ncbi:MAG TPA: AAA family ATPase [Candidatus Babeliales bacterium]|nr:AAA family ATPase [Candidatus Babeliales bacterium]
MQTGKVILLNGTSSAGKSSVLKEMHQLNPAYVLFNVDDWFPAALVTKAVELGLDLKTGFDPWLFLHDYLLKKTGEHYFAPEARELLFTEIPPMYRKAKEAAQNGRDVIIDAVMEYETKYEEFHTFFKDFQMVKVLLYCPVDVLIERIEQRNESGVFHERRFAFLAFEQFPALYKLAEGEDDFIIDTIKSRQLKNALEFAINKLINNGIPDPYIPKLNEFRNNFIERFKLDKQEEVQLTSTRFYDLILNTAKDWPIDIAKKVDSKVRNVGQ